MEAWLPALSDGTQAFLRAGYGALMFLTLLHALPQATRFFVSERWGGYARSSRGVDAIQNPVMMPGVLALWIGATVAVAAGWMSPWPALVNLCLCRYFFIHMRWKGVLRGMGAPGFIAYWLGLAVFLLEYCGRFAPELRSFALLVLQVDLALIMLSAGIYKATAGYADNEGMEFGLCNPMWGYWWRQYMKLPPRHRLFWAMNQLAWTTEVLAAALMLLPPTREIGGVLLAASFIFILTQIRLGFLAEMMALTGVLFVAPGGALDRGLSWVVASGASVISDPGPAPAVINGFLAAALALYLALLPLAHAGLYYNFYARRALPGSWQAWLDRYTNLFGIIIWRVFSADLVNFSLRIYEEAREGGRTLLAVPGSTLRFSHVGEMICLTSLFTTLKYYAGNPALFEERLLRYARTLPRHGGLLVFEYLHARKEASHLVWLPVAEYTVDVDAGRVDERLLDPAFSPRSVHLTSPVHEGALPGSYVPARR